MSAFLQKVSWNTEVFINLIRALLCEGGAGDESGNRSWDDLIISHNQMKILNAWVLCKRKREEETQEERIREDVRQESEKLRYKQRWKS